MSAPDASGPARAAVVYNPVKVDLDALRAAVRREEESGDWAETLWIATSEEDPGGEAARKALDEGVGLVVAAGGDGTIRAIAEQVAGTEVPMGLLPAGTGNLLARNLDLGVDDLERSVRTAFQGRDRPIDTGEVEIRRADGSRSQHRFLVMAGVGIDATMLASTNEQLKSRIGWLAYVGALVKALRDTNRISMRYAVDGRRTRRVHAHTVIVGNCGTLTADVLLLPDAVVDDGLFDAVFFRPSDLRGWIQVFRKVFWENGVLRRLGIGERLTTGDIDALNYVRGRRITVALSSPQEVELDGDPIGTATAFRIAIDRRSLLVRVPPEKGE